MDINIKDFYMLILDRVNIPMSRFYLTNYTMVGRRYSVKPMPKRGRHA